ncbi:MAG: sigma-70 family RNA polymerase sigma factor [Nocardioidaceae bacterium]
MNDNVSLAAADASFSELSDFHEAFSDSVEEGGFAAAPTDRHDAAAVEKLITDNIPLVGHLVRETLSRVPSHVNRDDLVSAGLTALVQAGQAYDPARGVPFSRYAATRIRGALLDELRSVDWASRSVRRRARDLDETRARLATTLGRTATNAEVASALGVPLDEVVANDSDVARASVLSLQAAREGALDDLLVSNEPDPSAQILHREQLGYMLAAVDELPERLRLVVREYFLNERPMAEIAAELGVTESRVSQLRAEAMVLLRDAVNRAFDPDQVAAHARPGGAADRRRECYFANVAARTRPSRGAGRSDASST